MIHSDIQIHPTKYYVYALVNPINGDIAYVGQSCMPAYRYKQHLADRKLIEFAEWWRDIIEAGETVVMWILAECETEREARHTERQAMRAVSRSGHKLFNVTGTARRPAKEKIRIIEPKIYA